MIKIYDPFKPLLKSRRPDLLVAEYHFHSYRKENGPSKIV